MKWPTPSKVSITRGQVFSSTEATDLVRRELQKGSVADAAAALAAAAVEKTPAGNADNATCVIVQFA